MGHAAPVGADLESRDGGRRMPNAVLIFWAVLWAIWLVPAFQRAVELLPTTAGVVGLVLLIGYLAVYLAVFRWARPLRPRGSRWFSIRGALHPRLVLTEVILILLSAVLMVLLGQSAEATVAFAAILALWLLPFPLAMAVAVALGVTYWQLSLHLPGWSVDTGLFAGLALGVAASSMGLLAQRRQHALQASQAENAALLVQEERNRMARDLHDILGHSLTVITVKAELARRLFDADPERARAELGELEGLSRNALGDVRRAVEGFREISLTGELIRAQRALRDGGIGFDLVGAVDQVPDDLSETFAWTVREGVTNVLRHSGASRCTVVLAADRIEIRDDGAGGLRVGAGRGLSGLTERAGSVGARLSVGSDDSGHVLSVAVAP